MYKGAKEYNVIIYFSTELELLILLFPLCKIVGSVNGSGSSLKLSPCFCM